MKPLTLRYDPIGNSPRCYFLFSSFLFPFIYFTFLFLFSLYFRFIRFLCSICKVLSYPSIHGPYLSQKFLFLVFLFLFLSFLIAVFMFLSLSFCLFLSFSSNFMTWSVFFSSFLISILRWFLRVPLHYLLASIGQLLHSCLFFFFSSLIALTGNLFLTFWSLSCHLFSSILAFLLSIYKSNNFITGNFPLVENIY